MLIELNITEVIVGILSFLGIIISSVFSFLSHKNSKQINSAVNNVGPKEPRIYDIVMSNQIKLEHIEKRQTDIVNWKDSFKESPWSTGDGAKKWLAEYESNVQMLDKQLSDQTEVNE